MSVFYHFERTCCANRRCNDCFPPFPRERQPCLALRRGRLHTYMDANWAIDLDELCPKCVYVRTIHVSVQHCAQCRWRLRASERICSQSYDQRSFRWINITTLGHAADRLARFNSVAMFAWVISRNLFFSEACIRKFIRVVATSVVAWLDRIGWLSRTPKLVACRLTELVLKRDFIEAEREDLRPACALISREFDASWLQLKQAVADSNTSIGTRLSKRRRKGECSSDDD